MTGPTQAWRPPWVHDPAQPLLPLGTPGKNRWQTMRAAVSVASCHVPLHSGDIPVSGGMDFANLVHAFASGCIWHMLR
jgi:hypothetical protein